MFDKAFTGCGLRTADASLTLYLAASIRVPCLPPSRQSTTYVLLVQTPVIDAAGKECTLVTLPGRKMAKRLGEYTFDKTTGVNRMSPRVCANHILEEITGTTANKLAEQRLEHEKALNYKGKPNPLERDGGIIARDDQGIIKPETETVFCFLNLKQAVGDLPHAPLITSPDDLPDHLGITDIPAVNAVRSNARWVPLDDVIGGVQQNYKGQPFAIPTKQRIPQFSLTQGAFASPTYITPESLYGLVRLCMQDGFSKTYRERVINPQTGKQWIAQTDLKPANKPNPRAKVEARRINLYKAQHNPGAGSPVECTKT